jgi:hypothetical protein
VEHQESDVAMVTLAIGEPYLSHWKKYSAAGWQEYAPKSGYDLIVLTEALDHATLAMARSPAWQKCLVLSQDFAAKYRQVILLDCDIAINTLTAPRITDQVPVERVGGVLSGSYIAEDLHNVLLSRLTGRTYEYRPGLRQWQEFQKEAYQAHGLTPTHGATVQTGVLVASPRHHRGLLEAIYDAPYTYASRCHEQVPLSHKLLSEGLFHQVDSRFNSVFYETLLVHYPYLFDKDMPGYAVLARYATRAAMANNFFLHFAYDIDLIQFLFD